jgi:hypothetical protein
MVNAPVATAPPIVNLTNPADLYYALEQAAQQQMGRNDIDQADINAFIASYHEQETAYQTGQTDIQPPSAYGAAVTWIDDHYPTQVAANRFLNDSNAINCMIQDGGPGPCPPSSQSP